MKKIHAKSSCCQARVYRFGQRRRQCSQCRRTITLRPKKRGRKKGRTHARLNSLALASQESLRHKAKRLAGSREKLRRRHQQVMEKLLKTLPQASPPSGPLVAVIDGYQSVFNHQPWVTYLILLRSVSARKAVIMEPYFLKGPETIRGWEQALAQLPKEVSSRIKAVVSDGILGFERHCRSQGWIWQRCQCHLLRGLYPLLGRRWHHLAAKPLRQAAYQQVLVILKARPKGLVTDRLARLRQIVYSQQCPKRLGLKLRGFLKDYSFYRSYLKYPQLKLPTTTNAAESICAKIAELVRRTRSFSNPTSFQKWTRLLLRVSPTVQCNGHFFNRKSVS